MVDKVFPVCLVVKASKAKLVFKEKRATLDQKVLPASLVELDPLVMRAYKVLLDLLDGLENVENVAKRVYL